MHHPASQPVAGLSGRAQPAIDSAEFNRALANPDYEDLRAFLAYWQSKQVDGGIPKRCDIDPVDIPHLLPNVLMIDVLGQPPYDFHYRLLGTTIVAMDGVDYTGSLLSDMVPSTDDFRHIWNHHLDAAAGRIALRHDTLRWSRDGSRDHVDYVILLLPLRRHGDAIATLFGYIHYCMDDLQRPWSFRTSG